MTRNDNILDLRTGKPLAPAREFQSCAVKLDKPLTLWGKPSMEKKTPTLKWRMRYYRTLLREAYTNHCLPAYMAYQRRRCIPLIGQLMELGMALYQEDQFEVSIYYMGHVDSLEVKVFWGGYDKDKAPIRILNEYLPSRRYSKLKPGDIREMMKMLRAMKKLSHHHTPRYKENVK